MMTHVALCVFVWSWEDDGDFDIASCETELVPRLKHAASVLEGMVLISCKRSGGVCEGGNMRKKEECVD